jgi:FkbM family methyltransferase
MQHMTTDIFEQDIDRFVDEVDGLYGRTAFFRNDLHLGRSLREYGEWARSEIELLGSLLRTGSVVVDAGAFIGTHTMAFSKFVGATGKVLSFEPHPWYFRVLTRNISSNALANVLAYNCGLSDRSETMDAPAPDLSSANSFGSVQLAETTSAKETLRVCVRTLDEFQLASCDLIKADVEGMEARVLAGASHTIDRCQPIIYTECNSGNDAWPVVLLMQSRAYKVYLFSTKAFNPANYRHNSLNIFGEAMELGLVSVPLGRIGEFEPKWGRSNLVIPINTFDDLVLGLLKKPQYKHEVLARTTGATKWGVNFWLNEAERTVRETELGEARQLAVERADEIARMSAQLNATQAALEQTQQLAVERFNEIEGLSRRLSESQQMSARWQQEFATVVGSRSWRWTGPLRALAGGVKLFFGSLKHLINRK